MRAAVFLDRDGTIVEDRGHLSRPEDVDFYPDAFPALRHLQERFVLFIVTNQNGVAKGLVSPGDVERVNAHVVARLAAEGIAVRAVYTCPHQRADGCPCIKPKPFFLKRAEEEHGIDLGASWSVGDHPHDADLARAVGGRGIFLLTGHGPKHRGEIAPGVPVAGGIAEAADIILGKEGKGSSPASPPS